jgi:hypothetical protein
MKPTEYNFPTVVRNVYDVDAFEIIDRLKEKYQSNIDVVPEHLRDLEFIKFEEEFLIKTLKEDDFDLTEHQKHRNFIIPSNYNLYNSYLGYKLLTMDLYKIEPFLSYQSVLFLGNYYATKDNFIGLIEFLTYEFVKTRLFPFEHIRLEKIVNWLERNRIFLLNKAYNEIAEPIGDDADNGTLNTLQDSAAKNEIGLEDIGEINNVSNIKEEPKFRVVKMDPQFANVFCEKLKTFFETQEQLLHNLIIRNLFTERLVFNGNANQLAELFKRLRYNAKIDVASLKVLAEWIALNFSSVNENGVVEEINFNTIHQVLKKQDREPPKTKRILIEIAPYIMPDDRKTDKVK